MVSPVILCVLLIDRSLNFLVCQYTLLLITGLCYCRDLLVWTQHSVKMGPLLMTFVVVLALWVLEYLCVSGSHAVGCGSPVSHRPSCLV